VIIRAKQSRARSGALRSGRDIPPVERLPGWEALKEGLLGEVLALVDQVDGLAPGDDLVGVESRLAAIEGRLSLLRPSRRGRR
jgi:hypothetical protein